MIRMKTVKVCKCEINETKMVVIQLHIYIVIFFNVQMIVNDVKYLNAIIDSGNTE